VKPSTPRKYTQAQITTLFYDFGLNKEYGTKSELKSKIWENPQNPNSLRFAQTGWLLAGKLRMKHYRFDIDFILTAKRLLQLERILVGPYYIKGKWTTSNFGYTKIPNKPKPIKLFVFDEQDAIMLGLYGDIQKFLDNQEEF
jgi:hypothetical protein